jgi:hypothetical protein
MRASIKIQTWTVPLATGVLLAMGVLLSQPIQSSPGATQAEPVVSPEEGGVQDESVRALEVGRSATDSLMYVLGGELKAAVASGGPHKALHICNTRAQAITDSLYANLGIKMRRVSERYRNPIDAPDEMELAILRRFGDEDAPVETLLVRRNEDGTTYHYMRAIRIDKAVCIKCHGKREKLSNEVVEALAALYPKDLATGYTFGDLRGAFSVLIPRAALLKASGGMSRDEPGDSGHPGGDCPGACLLTH